MATYRSLAETNDKILKKSRILEDTLAELLAKERPRKVLEVGFGRGRTLLELAWRFRGEAAIFYGVDKKQKPPLEKREDLRDLARQFEIIPEAELANFELPEIFFYDATRLHFDDDGVDLVYSAVSIRFIERRAEFLEEVCRVLKPGGVALLDMGEPHWNYPYSLISDNVVLTPYTNRFVLKYRDELIPLPIYLKLFENDAFQFSFLKHRRCVLQVRKFKSARLHLQLDFNHELSMAMEKLPYRHGTGETRGGFRCVYDVRPEIHRALFDQGLLSRDQLRRDVKLQKDSIGK